MKLKLYTHSNSRTRFLGEIEVSPPTDFTILRRLQQGVDFFVNVNSAFTSTNKPVVFQARKPDKKAYLTMDMLQKYGVFVFGRQQDVYLLLKSGRI